jgi:hypothetical protein
MVPEIPKHKFFTSELILRLVLFATMFVVVFTFALVSILGYQIDIKNANLNPTSMIQVSTVPTGSSVSINGQSLSFFSNNRASVVSGNYRIDVSRDGFYDWRTVLPIRSRTVWWLDARLTPKVKQVATVKTYNTLLASYASPDRRWMLNYLSPNLYELVDLRDDRPIYRTINLKTLLQTSLAEQDLVFYDWNLANDAMFFRDKTSNRIYSVGVNNRNHLINLSSSYPTLVFDQVKVGGDGGKTLYVLSNQELHRINLSRLGLTHKVASGVVKYRIINRDRVVVARTVSANPSYISLAIYDHNKGQLFEFERLPSDGSMLLEAFESRYDGYFYIALYNNHKFRVWRGDSAELNLPAKQLTEEDNTRLSEDSLTLRQFKVTNSFFRNYFSTYLESDPENVFVGGDGRLVLIDKGPANLSAEDEQRLVDDLLKIKGGVGQSVKATDPVSINQVLVFDTNYRMNYLVQLALNSGSVALAEIESSPSWLSDSVLWENIVGVVRVKDFNGQNQHKLIPADARYDIQLSANEKYVYFYQIIDNLPVLRRLQMTAI